MHRAGIQASSTAITLVHRQMQALKLDGLPHVDCKTYKGWKHSGFTVRKGEKSCIHGVTFVKRAKDDDDDDTFAFPKMYHLFHRSQVEVL